MEKITVSHGAGGELMHKLIERVTARFLFKRTPKGRGLDKLEDSGIIDFGKFKLAFTTDSYTVNPIFFPGGDIGKLAICGTVNDLAVMGALPIALSFSSVIEEGFDISDLEKIIDSASKECEKIKLPVITGDTKVVEKGKVDKIIINTAGIGIVRKLIPNDGAVSGNKIMVSGSVGEHGTALLAKRFGFDTNLKSDCSSILPIVKEVLKIGGIRAMKDPTRGGLAACLSELAKKSNTCFVIDENKIPIKPEVLAVGETLGIDPLQTACEGRVIMVVEDDKAKKILKKIKKFNKEAAIIGEVTENPKGKVILKTSVGGRRFLESPIGELYPRIC